MELSQKDKEDTKQFTKYGPNFIKYIHGYVEKRLEGNAANIDRCRITRLANFGI